MTGTLFGHPVSIFIDTGAIECFVDPKIVAKIPIMASFMAKPWTLEYGNRAECKVEQCLLCNELGIPSFQNEFCNHLKMVI